MMIQGTGDLSVLLSSQKEGHKVVSNAVITNTSLSF